MKGKIFNAQDVQAILNGSKVMFREVIKGAELEISHPAIHSWAQSPKDQKFYAKAKNDEVKQQYVTTFPFHGIKCPYQVGQKIFCKETFAEVEVGAGMGYNSGKQTLYKAVDDYDVKWKPAQHMKQEHSRLTPLIKEIKVERLASISANDALGEGISESEFWKPKDIDEPDDYRFWQTYPQMAFKNLWNATHKKPEEKFEASPWVWSILFEAVK